MAFMVGSLGGRVVVVGSSPVPPFCFFIDEEYSSSIFDAKRKT